MYCKREISQTYPALSISPLVHACGLKLPNLHLKLHLGGLALRLGLRLQLLGRLVGYIALKGLVPSRPFWPFATGAVAFVWVVLFFVLVLYHA